LHIVLPSGNIPIIKTLLENGISIDEEDHTSVTPLQYACYNNNMMLVRLCIEKGANIFRDTPSGLSPIYYACAYNQKQLVQLFLEQGLDVNFQIPSQKEVMIDTYLNFIESQEDISSDKLYNICTKYVSGGESLLHIATKNGHLYMVQLLLDNSAYIDIQDESENTALHYAAAGGKKDIVAILIKHGANTDITNIREQKALDYANMKGYNEIAVIIL